jgi:hypothetical protein
MSNFEAPLGSELQAEIQYRVEATAMSQMTATADRSLTAAGVVSFQCGSPECVDGAASLQR